MVSSLPVFNCKNVDQKEIEAGVNEEAKKLDRWKDISDKFATQVRSSSPLFSRVCFVGGCLARAGELAGPRARGGGAAAAASVVESRRAGAIMIRVDGVSCVFSKAFRVAHVWLVVWTDQCREAEGEAMEGRPSHVRHPTIHPTTPPNHLAVYLGSIRGISGVYCALTHRVV